MYLLIPAVVLSKYLIEKGDDTQWFCRLKNSRLSASRLVRHLKSVIDNVYIETDNFAGFLVFRILLLNLKKRLISGLNIY